MPYSLRSSRFASGIVPQSSLADQYSVPVALKSQSPVLVTMASTRAICGAEGDQNIWNPSTPPVADPSGSGVYFGHRWGSDPEKAQATYSYFRDRIHVHAAEIEEAYEEENKERSIELWQGIFGDGFKAPATSSNSTKFPAAAPAAGSSTRGK